MTQIRDLLTKKCQPCDKGLGPLSVAEAEHLLGVVRGWSLAGKRIEKEYGFRDFVDALGFVNEVARIAESEGHHPDIAIHYNKVKLTLWTHVLDGLSENDFILAAKIDSQKTL